MYVQWKKEWESETQYLVRDLVRDAPFDNQGGILAPVRKKKLPGPDKHLQFLQSHRKHAFTSNIKNPR